MSSHVAAKLSSDLPIDADVEGVGGGTGVMDVVLRVLRPSVRGALSHRGVTTAPTSSSSSDNCTDSQDLTCRKGVHVIVCFGGKFHKYVLLVAQQDRPQSATGAALVVLASCCHVRGRSLLLQPGQQRVE